MAETPTLSLVIPCYNKQDNLHSFLAIFAFLNRFFLPFLSGKIQLSE
jgi:hypothetical protein